MNVVTCAAVRLPWNCATGGAGGGCVNDRVEWGSGGKKKRKKRTELSNHGFSALIRA